jgi:shikimate dehydrogenase
MKVLAVIGNPIKHSKSPQIFKHLSSISQIPLKYGRIELPSNCEASLIKKIALSLDAINITSPFKKLATTIVDIQSNEVKNIQATNLLVNKNGILTAYNTDTHGISKGLKHHKNGNILILGAGGAAKAAAYLLSREKLPAFILNRTEVKAQTLALNYVLQPIKNSDIKKIKFSTIINTVPSSDFVSNILETINYKIDLFIDAIYPNPEYSSNPKIKKYIPGEVWLWEQAIKGFELITGEKLNLKELPKIATPPNLKEIYTDLSSIKEYVDFQSIVKIK